MSSGPPVPEQALVVVEPEAAALDRARRAEEYLRPTVEAARRVMEQSIAPSSRVTYGRILRAFHTWCAACPEPLCPMPADPRTVILYLQTRTCRYSALRVILAAIRFDHAEHGLKIADSVQLDRYMKATRRVRGTAKTQKAAATAEITRQLVDTCASDEPLDVRDRALLLLLFGGAFRRSELAQRTWDDIEWTEGEILVFLERSKTDQFGAGQTVRVASDSESAYCPAQALKQWEACLRGLTGSAEGALFRSLKKRGYLSPLRDPVIAQIVKARAEAAGLDPSDFSGHSARRGYVTSHVRAGTPIDEIRVVTRHKSAAMVAEYVEASKKIGRNLL